MAGADNFEELEARIAEIAAKVAAGNAGMTELETAIEVVVAEHVGKHCCPGSATPVAGAMREGDVAPGKTELRIQRIVACLQRVLTKCLTWGLRGRQYLGSIVFL
jgi:hypothetical protein